MKMMNTGSVGMIGWADWNQGCKCFCIIDTVG